MVDLCSAQLYQVQNYVSLILNYLNVEFNVRRNFFSFFKYLNIFKIKQLIDKYYIILTGVRDIIRFNVLIVFLSQSKQ